MAENSGETTHIKCRQCTCQYINDDEHIKNDFGYSRLGKQYKLVPDVEQGKRQKATTPASNQ